MRFFFSLPYYVCNSRIFMPISIVSQVWSWIWLSREECEKIMHAFTPEQSSRAHQMCVNGHPNAHTRLLEDCL